MPTVVTLGEAMLRFSAPVGESLESAFRFDVRVAGAEANVAVGLARLRVSAGWLSWVGGGPLGRRVVSALRLHGVDTAGVVWTPAGRVGTYYVEYGASPRSPRVLYDRAGSAFARGDPDEIDWSYLEGAAYFHTTGISAAVNRHAVERALEEASRRGVRISFDVNYRARLWSTAAARAGLEEYLPRVHLLFCTSEDARRLFGLDGPAGGQAGELARRYRIPTVVVTDGSRGAVCRSGDRELRTGGHPVQTVDRIGAGDAFVAGFLAGLLEGGEGEGPELALRYGSACAALKHTYYGDVVWADREEVRQLALAGQGEPWR